MQKFWMKYEYTDKDAKHKGVLSGYKYVRSSKDAVARAKADCRLYEYDLKKIWMANFEDDPAKFALIFGKPEKNGVVMALDDVSVAVHKSYKESKGKKQEKSKTASASSKPRIRLPAESPKPSIAPYTVIWSNDYIKQRDQVHAS